MAAARRAAIFASLRSERDLLAHGSDPASLDAFCLLSVCVDRACISDASLAAAAADPDAHVAAVSRVLLLARAILRESGALTQPATVLETENAFGSASASRVQPLSLVGAIEFAKTGGFGALQVPRTFLNAVGATESETIALLRAAFSHDGAALVRSMASEFDVAELRTAERLVRPRSLRAGLRTAGAAFRGGESRERTLDWANRLHQIRRCARKKHGALRAAVDAIGTVDDRPRVADRLRVDDRLRNEADAADKVWERHDTPTSFATRVTLLCDALAEHRIDDELAFVPFGAAEPGEPILGVEFASSRANAIDSRSFASALSVDEASLGVDLLKVDRSMYDAAAAWLTRGDGFPPAHVWPQEERGGRIVAPAMTFSASRLNLYAMCPRRWYFEYLCGALPETTTTNAVYGKVFHAALESLHADVRMPADWESGDVFNRLCELLDVAFGQAHHEFASQLEYEVLRLRARQVARHYVRWLFEEAADAPLEIVEIESRQILELGGHRFVGYIDRVDRPKGGGPITIFDYKTGRIEEDPDEYLRQVRTGEEAQLALYYAMRRAQGDEIARIALVSIRDARDKTWILALDISDDAGKPVLQRADRAGVVRASCSVADLERSLEVLTARCDLIAREGVEHFAVGSDPPCSYCAYAFACRERPARGERIFAR